ncbi:MAG TPA: protein kinase [Thermoanaerobaculia bacterium]|nr:protein kinase [Thermoanaerobaculia bacterium]
MGDDLAPGTILASYRIEKLLGKGGMGEVYLAEDLRLKRQVALKVLAPEIRGDSHALQRFQREAEAAAALHHSNICTIHEIGEAVGRSFIVMELCEGSTLRERIARGPLPVEEALDLAIQIADALEEARRRSVVHRDIKSSNILVSERGQVKVLDFGLAKHTIPRGEEFTSAPTVLDLTGPGVPVGTPSYMSPEQVLGKYVDHRSDIFSFGVVLYEMLAGRLPFVAASPGPLLDAILHHDPPPLARYNERVPDALIRVLAKMLAKKPEERYQSVYEIWVDLRQIRAEMSATARWAPSDEARAATTEAQSSTSSRQVSARPIGPAPTATERSPRPRRVSVATWAIAAVIGALLLAAGTVLWKRSEPRRPSDRSEWVQLTDLDYATQPALSPDGRMLAFIRGIGTFMAPGQIYVKPLPDKQPVALTADALKKMSPVFSPDGSRIAYTAGETWDTWIVPVLRGEPRPWLTNASGLTWIGPGQLLFSEIKTGIHMAIVTSDENRASARDLYVPASTSGMAHRSYLSPDGKWIVVVEMDERGEWLPCRLVAFDGGSAPSRLVGPAAARCTGAAWSPDGAWIYVSADAGDGFHVWRQRFPDGMPEQITAGPTEEEGLAMDPDGRSLITSMGLRRRSVWIHDDSGDRQVSVEGYAYWPLLTADGSKLLYRVSKGEDHGASQSELWMVDLAAGYEERLLPGRLVTGYGLSRDGRVVAAVAEGDGETRLWLAWIDGRAPPRPIPNGEGDIPTFGGDGEVFFRGAEDGSRFLYRIREDGSGRQKVDSDVAPTSAPSASPDGEWVAVGGQGHLTAYSTRGAAPRRITNQAARMRWSGDGRSLFLSVPSAEVAAFALGRTYILPLPRDSMLPQVPAGGFRSEDELAAVPGVVVLPYGDVAPGPSASGYAFSRLTVNRNLYRIPLH